MTRLRIGIIAGTRFPIRQPYAGGMEAHTHALAGKLQELGHDVVLFASAGPPEIPTVPLPGPLRLSADARADVSMPPASFIAEHHAYLRMLLGLDEHRLDVLHNNSLHYLPVAMAPALPAPVVTTLHSPPTPWLESAVAAACPADRTRFVSVSETNARAWRATSTVDAVIHNGVDTTRWTPGGRARRGLVWTGRIVPEKGTHIAVRAAQLLGAPLDIAGPVHDRAYFCETVAPALGERIRYVGHLETTALAELVGSAEVALITPQWEEPYGLVVAEALSCGTPVAALPRGAIPELVDDDRGRVAADDTPEALARAALAARGVDHDACRAWALANASVTVMTRRYVDVYEAALAS